MKPGRLTPAESHKHHPANMRWFRIALKRMARRIGPIQMKLLKERNDA